VRVVETSSVIRVYACVNVLVCVMCVCMHLCNVCVCLQYLACSFKECVMERSGGMFEK
jgi:hypothetical protein